MKNKAFQKIIDHVPDLTHSQRVTLKEKLCTLEDEKVICDLLEERIEKNPLCVHCHSSSIIKHGHRSGLIRYRCKSCGKTFNALTGTPLARLRKKELWLSYSQCILNSFTVRNSAKLLGVNSKTSFRWRHRFLTTSHKIEPDILSGIVEADETFFRKSMKGSRNLTRTPRKRGEAAPQRGLSREHVSVLVACDRNGHEADYITGLGPVPARWLDKFFTPHICLDALLITDNASAFKAFSRHRHVNQKTVTAQKGERVTGAYHIQHVNAYHSQLKKWIRCFNGVATKYLNNYLGWCHELFNLHISSPSELLRIAFYLKPPLTGT